MNRLYKCLKIVENMSLIYQILDRQELPNPDGGPSESVNRNVM